jgi:hypothetical protein
MDVEVVQVSSMASSNPQVPSFLRHSELFAAVTEKEKGMISGSGDIVPSIQLAPVKTADAPADIKTDSVTKDAGKGSGAPTLNDVATVPSPWKVGVERLAEASRNTGRGILRRDSSSSLSLASDSPKMSSTTTESVLKLAPESSTPAIPEPPTLPVAALSELDNKKGGNIGSAGTTVSGDVDISPVAEKVECFRSQGPPDTSSSSISPQLPGQVAANVSLSTTLSVSTVTPTPVPPKGPSSVKDLNRSLRISTELMKILLRSTDERQRFLDGEFEATKALLDKLVNATCRIEKKKITDLWKEKIRCALLLIESFSCFH